MSKEIEEEITHECSVRFDRSRGGKFRIRIGPVGWHWEAELLDRKQAKKLRDLLGDYLGSKTS